MKSLLYTCGGLVGSRTGASFTAWNGSFLAGVLTHVGVASGRVPGRRPRSHSAGVSGGHGNDIVPMSVVAARWMTGGGP